MSNCLLIETISEKLGMSDSSPPRSPELEKGMFGTSKQSVLSKGSKANSRNPVLGKMPEIHPDVLSIMN